MKRFLKYGCLVILVLFASPFLFLAGLYGVYHHITSQKPGSLPVNVFAGPLGASVDPFIGTGGVPYMCANDNPAVCVPFGMVRLAPDTASLLVNTTALNYSGYYYGDNKIMGFSHTRIVGAGVREGGNFRVLPTLSTDVSASPDDMPYARFSHAQETAFPGYYAVRLNKSDILAELTATAHGGVHRYTFPAGREPYLRFDVTSAVGRGRCENGVFRMLPESREIEGSVKYFGSFSGRYDGLDLYFIARFNQPVSKHSVWFDGTVRAGAHRTVEPHAVLADRLVEPGDKVEVKPIVASRERTEVLHGSFYFPRLGKHPEDAIFAPAPSDRAGYVKTQIGFPARRKRVSMHTAVSGRGQFRQDVAFVQANGVIPGKGGLLRMRKACVGHVVGGGGHVSRKGRQHPEVAPFPDPGAHNARMTETHDLVVAVVIPGIVQRRRVDQQRCGVGREPHHAEGHADGGVVVGAHIRHAARADERIDGSAERAGKDIYGKTAGLLAGNMVIDAVEPCQEQERRRKQYENYQAAVFQKSLHDPTSRNFIQRYAQPYPHRTASSSRHCTLVLSGQIHYPYISELHLVLVRLQPYGARFGRGRHRRLRRIAGSAARYFVVFLHRDAVVQHSHPRLFSEIALCVKPGRAEFYVVGLPLERRQAHVNIRRRNPINGAAFVPISRETVTVEDLNLVVLLKKDPAVAPVLSPLFRQQGNTKFQVKTTVLELPSGLYRIQGRVRLQDPAFQDIPTAAFGESSPLFKAGAVKQHDGSVGRQSAQGRRFQEEGFHDKGAGFIAPAPAGEMAVLDLAEIEPVIEV